MDHFFSIEVLCHSVAFFHELLFENMTLKDNQFHQSSYLKCSNFHGTKISVRGSFAEVDIRKENFSNSFARMHQTFNT